ncbi:STAS domain-containing protein [Alteribacillus bidgolensis]|uniref:RsbT co-antagonist protein RsbR n=1 Tax=Alteribacillus bidgolensis TaxID=930129 RepID=A0A1G8IQF6_9BACI|nr:STAS domain-containing protein [Alteribacillus bidgolensis]SDI21278.1 rsbT co-antagonist protein RsbR [Alteribacillus bidgolensis]
MDNENPQTIQNIGEFLLKNKTILSEKMDNLQNNDSRFRFAKNNDYITKLREELFATIGAGVINQLAESGSLISQIRTWGEKAADYCIKHNVILSTALLVFPFYREILTEVIEQHCLEDNLPLHDAFYIYSKFESLLDQATYAFSHTFLHQHIVELEHAKSQMQEISVPVVPIKQGTAVLPLIGDMDDERSEFLQKRTLERATELELSYIIIDLSGINTINTWFAQHLNQLIDALQLLGIDASISGMRPELSQTIVQLGISFKHIAKFLTLEQALLHHSEYTS